MEFEEKCQEIKRIKFILDEQSRFANALSEDELKKFSEKLAELERKNAFD